MSELTNHVELSISCRKLKDMDVFSKSDPMVVVYEIDEYRQKYREIGRTEIIWNNLNPNFATKFTLDFHFEECQKMKFEVYDIDSVANRIDLSKQDFIGDCITTLGEIVSSGILERSLRKGTKSNRGFIRLKAEEESKCKDEITLEFCGKKLDRKDIFGLSDPFLCFSRGDEDGSRTVCYRTEKVKTTLNPHWKQFKIPLQRLCNGDLDRPIFVECFDWNKNGSHALIGEFSITANSLLQWPKGKTEFPLINSKKQSKKKYKNSGTIQLLYCQKERIYSFIEYIQGDLEMCCTISVDFTKSNGDPRNPSSLHHFSKQTPTQYATALEAVGEIIQDYDSDKLFPAFGFGACLPPNGEVSHCFPLNGNPAEPSCNGIDGVLNAYYQTLSAVRLFGPTNFAPTINKVAGEARAGRDGSQYFILLILTDGVITDLPQTKEAIVRASVLPLSIIIVGIGNADFEAMDILDGDEERVNYNGVDAARDIVQFVPFREFLSQSRSNDVVKHALAKAVLEEVPEQLVSFMRSQNITPRPNRNAHRLSMSSTHSNRSAGSRSSYQSESRNFDEPCVGAMGISRNPPPYSP